MQRFVLPALLLAFACVLSAGIYASAFAPKTLSAERVAEFKSDIYGKTLPVQGELFDALVAEIGPQQAQEMLVTDFPANGIAHLFGHRVGRYLYKTEGMAGIQKCQPFVAGACYHGFMNAAIVDEGMESIDKLNDFCETGLSKNQELECPHGVGHGLLAIIGYDDLPKALDTCKEIFDKDTQEADRVYCYEGVFMENNLSDNAGNSPTSGRWYKADDPMYPCNAPEVGDDENVHKACMFMQGMIFITYPQFDNSFARVADFCDTLSTFTDRNICFVTLTRQILFQSGNDINAARTVCADTFKGEHEKECIWTAAGTAYYYGDRSKDVLGVCEQESDDMKDSCYQTLTLAIARAYSTLDDRVRGCRDIVNEKYHAACIEWMHGPDPSRMI